MDLKRSPFPPRYLRRFTRKDSYHFVALTWGTRGDVQPFVALGVELARRGHRLTVAARGPFRAMVEERGLSFYEMEEDGTDELMASLAESRGGAGEMAKLFVKWQRDIVGPELRQFWEASEGADVIVSNGGLATPAPHVAEARGVPLAQAYFDPIYVPTRRFGLYADRIADRGPLKNLLSTRARNILTGLATLDIVSAWRRSRGLSVLSPFEIQHPSVVLQTPAFAAWSAALLERPDDWGDLFAQTGRWRWPGEEAISPALLDFMQAGPPPVYIGFGSWGVHDRAAVTDILLEALRATGNRAVLHRNTVDGRGSFPEGVYVGDDLPHEWLFPRSKVVIHHGGAGTTGAATSAGVPQVVIPAFFGQVAWADIIERLGIGAALSRRELSAQALREAIDAAERPGVRERAKAAGERARAEGGVKQAADILEQRLREAAP
jgi:sterol 3beta-glucosyltransferase